MNRPQAWTGQEAQGLPGATCRLDWVIIDRLLASAVEDGDQAAAIFWQCHLVAFRAEIEQFSS